MAKNNRKCVCCGTEYRYCNSCAEDQEKPAWYAIYHNENCKNIFTTASDYFAGVLSKDIAKINFEKCDLSDKEHFEDSIKKAISETCIAENETVTTMNVKVEVSEEEHKYDNAESTTGTNNAETKNNYKKYNSKRK